MPKKIDLDRLLKNNPSIDAKELLEGLKLTKKLRRLGIARREYGLPMPLTRKRIHSGNDSEPDPRMVRLRR